MIAKDLISDLIIQISAAETYRHALSVMNELRVSHLPVVNGAEYIGLLADKDIDSGNGIDEAVGLHTQSLLNLYISDFRHVFEVMQIFAGHKLTLLPVLDENNHFVGIITLESLIQKFTAIASVQNPGSVIVIERSYKDYSFSEIAQIIESNNANILSMFITTTPESSLMEISIKISSMEPGPILQTFNRYNYIIKATYGETSYYDDLKDRYNQLMTYLNV